MIRGDVCGFLAGSHAILGRMANSEYSHQPCIIEEFSLEKKLWKVQLADPRFQNRHLSVKETCLALEWYVAPSERWTPLPSYLRVSQSNVGNALFCDKDIDEGVEILEEHPVMVVTNRTGLAARWKLHREMSAFDPTVAALRVFEEFTEGGVSPVYMEDASTLLSVTGHRHQDVTEERLAGILARWQSNSLNVSISFGESQSALYRFACKANHSCDANCVTVFDMGTGCMILRTRRRIQRGEQLTINYFGADPDFAVLSAEERRTLLSKRDFVCCCSRCVREGGDEPQSSLARYKEELRDLEKQRKKIEEKQRRKDEKEKERAEKERQGRKRSSRRSSSKQRVIVPL
eukprot:CAMPEP_0197645080 /NCGR_PEP_ID=MMETSP1338-20131121/17846_1 /TAXON_ID=43686 ORGANISM="Pelagodinium beii, Strain RCC1491" /NCGR_SAMPLE_ID=MMETSP1338 /ASSEMBLY_ACC=CAM_ASM_000754 /LENGTH=346 /DNA_ID=CAMNT_0043218573 /DNA_START=26 /DNA_END=1066 /DNA_ORIENTATION=+